MSSDNNSGISRKGIFCFILGSVITSIVSTTMSAALPVIMSDFSIPAGQAQMITSSIPRQRDYDSGYRVL